MKRNVYIMYAMALLQGMVFYGSIATLYRQAQGISVFQITIIESLSLVLCLVLELPWGVLADRIGYKATMIFCSLLFVGSKVVFMFAASFWAFLAERLMLSVVFAGYSGVDSSILYLSAEPGQSQKAFGIYSSLGTAGLILSTLIFSVFVKSNYRLAALLTVVSHAAAALLSLFIKEVKPEKEDRLSAATFFAMLKTTLKNRRLLMLLAAGALIAEANQTITVFLNQLQYVRCGLGDGQIGYIYIGVTIVGMFAGVSARLTKKLGAARFAAAMFIAAAAACMLLGLTRSAWLSVAAVVVLRLPASLYAPLSSELQNRQVTSGNRATQLSINALMIDGVGISTNLVFGKLSDIKLTSAFFAGGVFCLLGLALFFAWFRGRPRSEAKSQS